MGSKVTCHLTRNSTYFSRIYKKTSNVLITGNLFWLKRIFLIYSTFYFCQKQIVGDKTFDLIIEDPQKWVEINAKSMYYTAIIQINLVKYLVESMKNRNTISEINSTHCYRPWLHSCCLLALATLHTWATSSKIPRAKLCLELRFPEFFFYCA